MTTAATQLSGGRDPGAGRWLVAGDASWSARLREAMPREAGDVELVSVPNFLAALGSLGHEPAEVVIGPAALLGTQVKSTTDALRELAPQAKLLVLAEPDDDELAREAVAAGFDGRLSSPVTRDELSRALGAIDRGGDDDPSAEPADDHQTGGDLSDVALDHDEQAMQDRDDASDDLGDVDLIQRILSGSGVRAAAMHVVRTRSRCDDVFAVEDERSVPAGQIQSRITQRGRDFGVLYAPQSSVTQADLDGWAGWLAHWLALDEQFTLLKDLSMRDALTGVWNRRYFDRFLKRILDWARRERSQVTLLVFDIDDFKIYNDRYGHSAGDDILRECSKLMLSVVREHDVVARIGGDEFAVIFWDADPQAPRQPNSRHPEDVVSAATRFQRAICSHQFPKLLDEAPGTLTISGGLASFPWDGRTPQELLDKADEMAMQSKRQGKNAIKFGPGAQRICQAIQRQ